MSFKMVKVASGGFKNFLYNNWKKTEFIFEKYEMYKLKLWNGEVQ